jgi:hypothetical protein
MLAVPCGLPSYMGAWPPVVAGARLIAPMAELAACTPHSAATSAPGEAAEPPQAGAQGAAKRAGG